MISIQHAWRRCMITSGLIIRLVLHNKPEASSNLVKNIQNQSKNVLQVLPTERVLHVLSFLELKPYIVSHGVCKEWQQLLPLANIHPIRRRLFNLFHHMLSSPHFLEMRGWTLQHLQPFDRKAYIDSLLSQYPFILEEFRIWTLEYGNPDCQASKALAKHDRHGLPEHLGTWHIATKMIRGLMRN